MGARGSDTYYASIAHVAARIRNFELSPVEVTSATLERIHEINPRLSAYYAVFDEPALRDARTAERQVSRGDYRGPLHGIPIAIKDIVAVGPTTAGSELHRHHVPGHEAAVVIRTQGGRSHHRRKAGNQRVRAWGLGPRRAFSGAAQSLVNYADPRGIQLWCRGGGGRRDGFRCNWL